MSWANPTVAAIILILGISILTISAWLFFRKGKVSVAVSFVLLLGCGLHLSTMMDTELHNWDEKYHALVAKNLIEDPAHPVLYKDPVLPFYYTDWTRNHTWLHKPPLPLWLISCSMRAFGITPFAVRLPSLFLFLVGLLIIFRVGKYFKNEATGLIAMWLMAINGLINDLGAGRTNTDHYDLMFLVFILGGIYAGIRHVQKPGLLRAMVVGLLLGAALLTKWLPGLIVLPVWLSIGLHEKLNRGVFLGHIMVGLCVAALVTIPWQLYIFEHYPLEAAFQNVQNWRRALRGDIHHEGGYAYYLVKLVVNYSWICLPALGYLGFRLVKRFSFQTLSLALWVAIPLIFFSLVKVKTQAYILPIAPALFVSMGIFAVTLIEGYKEKLKGGAMALMTILAVVSMWPGLERLKLFQEYDVDDCSEIRELSTSLNDKYVLVEEAKYVEVMLYTDALAYRDTLTPAMIDHLYANGYKPFRRKGSSITPVN